MRLSAEIRLPSLLALSASLCVLLGAPVHAQEDSSAEDAAPAVSGTPGDMLAQAKERYEQLEYDLVIPLAEGVLAAPKATVEQRLDAYLLQGSSLAIVGNPIDAEKPFRFLLRGRPDFDMPPETPPKILAVFRKVQVEERTIREQMQELERKRIIEQLVIEDAEIEEATGGQPVVFDVAVRDPRGAVAKVAVRYKRDGQAEYSVLPLTQDASGRWRGEIPGEWTENDDGLVMQYFIGTAGNDGSPLLDRGSESAPLTVDVAPGSVGDGAPFYQTFWFWGLTVVTAGALAASGGAVAWLASQPPPSDLGPVHIR